jgi:hypothetical protein
LLALRKEKCPSRPIPTFSFLRIKNRKRTAKMGRVTIGKEMVAVE